MLPAVPKQIRNESSLRHLGRKDGSERITIQTSFMYHRAETVHRAASVRIPRSGREEPLLVVG